MKGILFRTTIILSILLLIFQCTESKAQEAVGSMGIIAEGYAGMGSGVGVVMGYHFSPNFFTGAGVSLQYAPGTMIVPVFADARVSFGPGQWAPSLGVGAGIVAGGAGLKTDDTKAFRPYASLTLGARRRALGASGNRGLWLGLCGEMAATLLLSLRVGYSF